MIVKGAKYLSLDTSHLNALAKDKYSFDERLRAKATKFERDVLDRGYVILISLHQFEEMIKHRDDAVAAKRVSFICSLECVAWISPWDQTTGLGSVLDVFIREVIAALKNESVDVFKVRDSVRTELIKVGTGRDAISMYLDIWEALRPILWAREARTREISAISAAKETGGFDPKEKVLPLLISGKLRNPEDRRRVFCDLERNLAEDISKRGDKRIPDPSFVAKKFYEDILRDGEDIAAASSPMAAILEMGGIDIADITPKTTYEDVLRTSQFNGKLRVASKILAVPFEEVKSIVKWGMIPSSFVQEELLPFRLKQDEGEGGDLLDGYLASLSPYIDIVFVDKRMKEAVVQAVRRSPKFRKLINRVEKVASYSQVIAALS